jgi:hypothetical protein
MANKMMNINNTQQMGECYDELGNPIECPEQTVADTGAINVKDQNELNYANSLIDDYMSNNSQSFPDTFEALAAGEPVGATAEADEYTKPALENAPFFSSESWYGLKYIRKGINPTSPTPTRVVNKNVSLLESNFEYINQYGKLADDVDYQYANTLFSTLGKVPVINGKALDLAKLPELMKDPAMKEQIMKAAGEYEKLPEVQSNWDLNWDLNMNHVKQEVLRDRVNDGTNIIYNDLKTVAGQLDSKFKAKREWQPSFLELFNDKGAMISEKEYNALLLKKTNESIAKWDAENPKPKETAPVFWQRTDQPNPMGQKAFFDPIANKWVTPDSRPKMQSSQEGWEIARENNINAAKQSLKNHPSYKKMVASLSAEYNQPDAKGVNRVRTLYDSKDNPFNTPLGNAGGRVQSIPKLIKYDLGNGLIGDDGQPRDEAIEFSNVLELAVGKEKDKIFYGVGGIAGKLPEERDVNLETFITDVTKEIGGGKHGKEYMPSGSIKFQNIAAGNKNMHAYNVTFDTDFLKRFVGTKDDKGPLFDVHEDEDQWNDIKNNGITIYVPKQISEGVTTDREGNESVNSLFANYSKRASETSSFEAQFRRRNKINLTLPNCGSRTIIRNADNSISIVGYNLSLDPSTKKYQKVLIKQATIPGAQFFDLDDLIDRTLTDMKDIYDNNGQIHSSLLDQQNSAQ